jgi:hydroxymethylpyrimidine pyrophosphatase-like HAD family hydrolase
MVYFNGAEITDMPDGKPFYPALVGKEVIDFCVDISREQGIYFQAYFPAAAEKPWNILRSERHAPETDMYGKHTGTKPIICDIKEALSAPDFSGCIKGMFLTEPERQEGIRARLLERFGSSIYIARTLITFLEVMATGISKGSGLKLALNELGLSPGQAMAFGDEESDLPMFGIAGVSAAPANAKDRVKEKADIVIGTNAEDAVAEFLERTFLR